MLGLVKRISSKLGDYIAWDSRISKVSEDSRVRTMDSVTVMVRPIRVSVCRSDVWHPLGMSPKRPAVVTEANNHD